MAATANPTNTPPGTFVLVGPELRPGMVCGWHTTTVEAYAEGHPERVIGKTVVWYAAVSINGEVGWFFEGSLEHLAAHLWVRLLPGDPRPVAYVEDGWVCHPMTEECARWHQWYFAGHNAAHPAEAIEYYVEWL